VNDAAMDIAALAWLRPGMPESVLRETCGSQWDDVKPGPDGWVVKLVHLGFTARVDRAAVIGKVGFTSKFPSELAVDGLRIGMSFDAVLAVYPTLRHIEDVTVSAATLRRFATMRPDGIAVETRFRDGLLVAFDLEKPDAVYATP
jgi:hypothetical protein